MVKSRPPYKPPPTGRTNLASCIVATVFLIFIVIVALIAFFTVFKPKPPILAVNAVQIPAFSAANSTVGFTFSQYATLTNPNRAAFTHYDSSLRLLHAGAQVGLMFIPAGKVDAGRTRYMAATFSVQPFPLAGGVAPAPARPESVVPSVTDGLGGFRVGPSLEVESVMEMSGRVRVLHFFTHHLEVRADCRVSIAAGDGSVLGFHC
ncbi:late embryogenesis abundant protein [Striga asiatica]|uniref:Late embryogenesis abundant protein n=1 Tax=Striga asiatica TaxID=4170 RepID=A0A5A7P2Q5_STRAF|nr:late embryogenesis abundant protein [Striga asiatica]